MPLALLFSGCYIPSVEKEDPPPPGTEGCEVLSAQSWSAEDPGGFSLSAAEVVAEVDAAEIVSAVSSEGTAEPAFWTSPVTFASDAVLTDDPLLVELGPVYAPGSTFTTCVFGTALLLPVEWKLTSEDLTVVVDTRWLWFGPDLATGLRVHTEDTLESEASAELTAFASAVVDGHCGPIDPQDPGAYTFDAGHVPHPAWGQLGWTVTADFGGTCILPVVSGEPVAP